MYKIFGIVVGIIGFVWLLIYLCKSAKFDKFIKDLFAEKINTSPTTKTVISKIDQAEKGLQERVEINIKKVEKLKKDSNNITNFLGTRDKCKEIKEGNA